MKGSDLTLAVDRSLARLASPHRNNTSPDNQKFTPYIDICMPLCISPVYIYIYIYIYIYLIAPRIPPGQVKGRVECCVWVLGGACGSARGGPGRALGGQLSAKALWRTVAKNGKIRSESLGGPWGVHGGPGGVPGSSLGGPWGSLGGPWALPGELLGTQERP